MSVFAVSVALTVVDQVSRAEYMAAFVPEALRKHLPTIYLFGFALALVLLLFQRPRPRLVLGYHRGRGLDPKDNGFLDPTRGHKPFFLRNDGNETALNLRVSGADCDGEILCTPVGTHLVPGEEIALKMYRDGRVDPEIGKLFVQKFSERVRAGLFGAQEERLHIDLDYEDHDHRKFKTQFDIVIAVAPRENGEMQLQEPRVELVTRS